MSGPSARRFSRGGFIPLGTQSADRPTKDVMVDIPLAAMASNGTASDPNGVYGQQQSSMARQSYEKSGGFGKLPAGRRVKRSTSDDDGQNGEEGSLTRMGKIYTKILNFSFITRYIVYIVPLALLIAIPIIIGATAAKNARLGGVRIIWLFTWVEIVWLSLWVSKIFARSLPSIFQFLCGIVSSGTRKYATVLAALETPLTLVGWALASLATFLPLMTRNPDQLSAAKKNPRANDVQHWQRVLNKILSAALVASLIFFAERLLIHMISVDYHRKQFDSRIRASKRHVHLLSLLYEASRTLFPAYCSEFVEEDYIINDSVTVGTKLKGDQQRYSSAAPLRLIQNVGRVGDKITAAFGTVASELTGKQVFNPTSAHSVVVEALEKRRSSEALAKRIWSSFVVEGKDALYQDDIVEVLGSDRQNEAEEAFADIDRDCNGDISLDEMIHTVVEFGRERHDIAKSLADVDQAIHALDKLLCTIVFIIVVFVFVAFLEASFTATLATAGTALLSMSFVFATTAQEVLGSCIFLFVKHPYDVGDRVDINNEHLTVEHIALLYSIFKRVDNHKIVQIPHVVLNSGWIENVSRSKAMREQVKIYISFDTTMEDINLLKNEIQAFVLSKEHSRDFFPEVEVEVLGLAEMNKLELKVEVKHKSNWSNETLRATRRSKFMCALVLALRRIPIYAPGGGDAALGDVGKPTYSVAITEAEAEANRATFSANKEAKRLVPSTPPKEKDEGQEKRKSDASHNAGQPKGNTSSQQETRPSTAAASELTAVETLNARHPTEDSARDDWDNCQAAAALRRMSDAANGRGNGLLRRESTVGRRRAAGATATSVSPIAETQTPPLASSIAWQPSEGRRSPESGLAPAHSDGRRIDSVYSEYTSGVTAADQQHPAYMPPPPPAAPVVRHPSSNAFVEYEQRLLAQHRPLPPLQGQPYLPQQQPPPQRPLPRDP